MNEILQGTYMNPLTDFGFKKLFSAESNKELLIDFLNEIIKEERCITDIVYHQPYSWAIRKRTGKQQK